MTLWPLPLGPGERRTVTVDQRIATTHDRAISPGKEPTADPLPAEVLAGPGNPSARGLRTTG